MREGEDKTARRTERSMKLNKRAFKIITVTVSTLLLVLVISRMHLSDEVTLIGGEVVRGRIVEMSGETVVMEVRSPKDLRYLSREEIAQDKKGRPEIERGVWIVLSQAGQSTGLKWMLLALFLFALPPVVGAVRWRLLLRMQGIDLGLGRCTSLTYIGYLFNYVMLGLTGGDVVKAYYVSRETHRKTEAVLSVFMDRVIGLLALTALGLAVVLSKLRDPNFGNVILPMELFAVAGMFGVLMMLSRRLRRRVPETALGVAALGGGAIVAGRVVMMGFAAVHLEVYAFVGVIMLAGLVVLSPARRLLQWEAIRSRLGKHRIVREVDAAFVVYRKYPWTLGALFALSMAVHVLNVVGVYACGRTLGIQTGMTTYLVLIPVIVMISSIPISVAGLGVQETMFPFFFGLPGIDVGANEAAMLAFMFRFGGSFLWVVPGYVVLLLWRGQPAVGKVAEEALAETMPTEEAG